VVVANKGRRGWIGRGGYVGFPRLLFSLTVQMEMEGTFPACAGGVPLAKKPCVHFVAGTRLAMTITRDRDDPEVASLAWHRIGR
jgi:hypothetical protein